MDKREDINVLDDESLDSVSGGTFTLNGLVHRSDGAQPTLNDLVDHGNGPRYVSTLEAFHPNTPGQKPLVVTKPGPRKKEDLVTL